MKRFVVANREKWKKDVLEIKENKRFCKNAVERAALEFKNAGEIHFALEKIYGGTVDFGKQGVFLDNFASKVLEGLNNRLENI